MKKYFSILLSILMVFTAVVIPANAASIYPESRHDYLNGVTDVQTYTCPGSPAGMYITFSEDTRTEQSDTLKILADENVTTEILSNIIARGFNEKTGDTIKIEYGDGQLYGEFQGTALAGKTIYVPSDTVKITLTADDSVTDYGYKITDIQTAIPSSQAMVIYNVDGEQYPVNYSAGEALELHYQFRNKITGNKAIIGWQTENGEKLLYNNFDTVDSEFDYPVPDSSLYRAGGMTYEEYEKLWDEYYAAYNEWAYGMNLVLEGGKTYELTPVYCDVAIRSDEVYSFTNRYSVFCKNTEGYYYTDEHIKHEYLDYGVTFALSPLAPVGAIACIVLTQYWPTVEWSGSCCGFPLTVLLQHYGKIDMLAEQGVDCVRDLEPTDNVVSRINFYNNQAVAGFPTDNMGLKPGTKDYTRQLKKLYDTVASGKPVYLEYYGDSGHLLLNVLHLDIDKIQMAHGVLLTGAYTDNNGNHILLAYNNNSSNYYRGYTDIYAIDKDFTVLYDDYGDVLNGFSWNADISYLDSFPADSFPNPFAWHIEFLRNIFTNLIEMIKELFGITK